MREEKFLQMAEKFSNSLKNRIEQLKENKIIITPQLLNRAIIAALLDLNKGMPQIKNDDRRAAYFSAEFLTGNITLQSLATLSLEEKCISVLKENGMDIELMEKLPDPALGNGGLGRLAACLLESAAASDIPLDGYGIRYRYGIFKQKIENNCQKEMVDKWQQSCAFEKERPEQAETIHFGDCDVLAIPFDIPVIGKDRINRLRLWNAQAVEPIDFNAFKKGDFSEAYANSNRATLISDFLYPPDETKQGKELRLKQQYFFTAASIGSILKDFSKTGKAIDYLCDYIRIQLNDTHPVVAIPELIRRLCEDYNLSFEMAFDICSEIFSYTNHTVMAEALEKWDVSMFSGVLPKVYPYVVMINNKLRSQTKTKEKFDKIAIIKDNVIYMANLAVYISHKVNGVAKIHTEIIKTSVFKEWAENSPEKFINITNGISHRRWLCLANMELSKFISHRIGDGWRNNLSQLEEIKNYTQDSDLEQFIAVKSEKKHQLAKYLDKTYGIKLEPHFMYSVQIKRIHEYKRQLLNILAVLGLYIDLKSGEIKNPHPTAFIFAGKAATGYHNAKEIIRLINSVSDMIKKDETARKYINVVFVPDYNVKNAMKIIPAADLSEQLSTAGTEASGTGNMKLSLNGAPTIGTMDGATIEIVERAGRESNYIFGATKEDLEGFYDYDPMNIYYTNDRISRVIDLLKDGPAGNFEDIFKSLLFANGTNPADKYKVLMDYPSYFEARLKANDDYKNSKEYAKKCINNIAAASAFSSDRTVLEYNSKIWQ